MSMNVSLWSSHPGESDRFELYQTPTEVTGSIHRADSTRLAYLSWVREARFTNRDLAYYQHELDLLRFLLDNPHHTWVTFPVY